MKRFVLSAAAVASVVTATRLFVSSREWFVADDFYFLRYVQSAEISLSEVMLPTEARLIGAYRPLGLEGYFYFGTHVLGGSAFAFYVLGFLLQAATAGVAFRLARQLGLSARAAVIAGLLVLAAPPGMTATYCVANHNYLLAGLFYALAVSGLLEYLRTARVRYQLASCAALLCGLLSNDVCATMAAVSVLAALRQHGLAWRRTTFAAVLRDTWPQLSLVALFVDFRVQAVPLRQEGWFYSIDIGLDVLRNAWGNLGLLAGGELRLFALLCACAVVGWRAWSRSAAARAERLRSATRALVLPVGWLLAALFPFTVLAFPNERFALPLAVPAALVLGRVFDALLGRAPSVAPLFVLLAVPWSAAYDHASFPQGAPFRSAFSQLSRELRVGPPPQQVYILYGGPRLADGAQLERFRWDSFGGDLVRAVMPERQLNVELVPARDARPCTGACRSYELLPDLRLRALSR